MVVTVTIVPNATSQHHQDMEKALKCHDELRLKTSLSKELTCLLII
jgi:hypothetical protein